MEPVLKDGDRILVNKMIKGARLFNVFAALDNEDFTIHRMPGWGNFKRNDILVFNFPYQQNRWDSIRMDVMQYYVKRCIALPGDTLEIRGGFYKIRGCNEQVGNYQAQQYIANLQHPKQHGIVFGTFPYNKQLKWNIREFGPLPVPQKGHVVEMDRTTYHLYKQLIGWEQKKKLRLKDGQVLLGDSLISRYRFEKNYYPYFAMLFCYLIVANISGLIGFDAPTSNYSITLAMTIITFVLIQFNAIRKKGIKEYIKGNVWPPTNIFGTIAPLISLSFRIFGNILSGSILMSLLYQFTGWLSSLIIPTTVNFLGPVIAPVFHVYFDLFAGVIQTLVFVTISSILIMMENED